MLSAEAVRDALRVCYDSDLPVNIVDLGVLYDLRLTLDADAPGQEPRYIVDVTLLPRTAEEARLAMLEAQVSNRLAGLYAISRTLVRFVDTPPWTADRMSDAARAQLGLARPSRPGLVQIRL